jgi:MFS family permease
MVAIASSLTVLGNLIGPIVGGFVAGHYGITASFAVNSSMLVLTSLVVWRYLADVPPASGEVRTDIPPTTPLAQ